MSVVSEPSGRPDLGRGEVEYAEHVPDSAGRAERGRDRSPGAVADASGSLTYGMPPCRRRKFPVRGRGACRLVGERLPGVPCSVPVADCDALSAVVTDDPLVPTGHQSELGCVPPRPMDSAETAASGRSRT